MSGLICIQTYLTRESAELAKSALEANDIPAVILADDCGGMLLQLSDGVRLMVNEQDAENARKVLESSDK